MVGQRILGEIWSTVKELKQAEGAVKMLGGEVDDVVNFRIEEIGAERSLVRVGKKNRTALKYPRKAGVPGREPLRG